MLNLFSYDFGYTLSPDHYNRLPQGGHFAAWEQPKALTEELRAGFRSLRQ